MVHKNRFVINCVVDTWLEKNEINEILSALGGGNIRTETPQEYEQRLKGVDDL